jgi:acyl-CoA synthetase (AMP-forming)/AMP-acid ligase II
VDNITNSLAHQLQSEQNIQGKAVALLADHSIHYGFYMMALLKLECRVMLLSTRNSEAALVELMKKTDTKFLIYTKRFANISSQVIDQITGGESYLASDVNIDQLKEKSMHKPTFPTDDSEKDKTEKIPLIIHSSGTTGFPSPIYLSNRYLVHLVNQFSSAFGTVQSPKFLSLSPLFHVMGIGIFGIAIVGGTYIFPTNVSQNFITYTSLHICIDNCILLIVPTSC